jgi:hypothetical protein
MPQAKSLSQMEEGLFPGKSYQLLAISYQLKNPEGPGTEN